MDTDHRTLVVSQERNMSRDIGMVLAGGGVALGLAGLTVLAYKVFLPPKPQDIFKLHVEELVRLGITNSLPVFEKMVEDVTTKVLAETFHVSVQEESDPPKPTVEQQLSTLLNKEDMDKKEHGTGTPPVTPAAAAA